MSIVRVQVPKNLDLNIILETETQRAVNHFLIKGKLNVRFIPKIFIFYCLVE